MEINLYIDIGTVIYWKTFNKTILLGKTCVEIVLFDNTIVRNTSSGYHPFSQIGVLWLCNFLNWKDTFQFWHFPILTLSNFKEKCILTLSNSDTFRFWHFPILILSDSDTFQFWHFPILTLSNSDTFRFWHFPILTLSDSDTFQFLRKMRSDTFQFWHFPVSLNLPSQSLLKSSSWWVL